MFSISSWKWGPYIPGKEYEDASFANGLSLALAVADGVGRSPDAQGRYPCPSPASLAAKAAVKAIGKSFVYNAKYEETHIRQAFVQANCAVRTLNRELNLWKNCNYFDRDYAGTVVSCLVRQGNEFLYGFIGDCAVAQMSVDGELLWHTDDDVAATRALFPTVEAVGMKERFVQVRMNFRNNPSAKHATYGVLTGEEAALAYIKTGRLPCERDDLLLVYSDGLTPFMLEDVIFRDFLLRGTKDELLQYVAGQSSSSCNYEDKTLLVLRPIP